MGWIRAPGFAQKSISNVIDFEQEITDKNRKGRNCTSSKSVEAACLRWHAVAQLYLPKTISFGAFENRPFA
jgi:hypothetical protein